MSLLPRPPDFEARARIVASRERSLTVEAGAGTGKTTLLVERVLSRLEGGALLDRLAIITFTRKAAADLQRKLRTALAARAGDPRFSAALAALERAPIGTTDSFCRGLLAQIALEAGAPPDFTLADEVAASALRERAWSRLLDRATPAHEELALRLREAGVKMSALRDAAESALDQRDLELPRLDAPRPDPLLPKLRAALYALAPVRARCRVPDDKLLLRFEAAEAMIVEAERLDAATRDAAILFLKGGKHFTHKTIGVVGAWGGAEGKEEAAAALGTLDTIVEEHLVARGAHLLSSALDWIADFRREYETVKRERGVLDFRDLALLTRDVLRRDERLRLRLALQFDEILLDEVQDSDPLQMEIAFLLAASHPNSEDPIESRLTPGRLTLVGDPKQSIYRFRRADIELYARARRGLAAAGGDESIQANFRSHPAILDFVNRLFRTWMQQEAGETIQASAVDLLAGRTGDPDDATGEEPGPRVHVVLPDPARGAGPDAEVDALARTTLTILGRDGSTPWTVIDPETKTPRAARPGDVAILTRRAERGDAIQSVLHSAGVPAVVASGRRFYAREEIATLAAVLRSIVAPRDEFLRFAALRSAAFGFDDDALALDRWKASAADSPQGLALARANATFDRLGEWARRTTVADFLPLLVEELSLLTIFGARVGGRARASSLAMLVEGAAALEDAGFDALPDFVDWLTAQEGATRGESLGEIDFGEDDAVQLLTMHKSKGLEFPIVLLGDLTMGGGGGQGARVLPRRAEGTLAFRLGAQELRIETPDFEKARQEEKRREVAESVRLLYVATTRARDHLLFAWTPKTKGAKGKRFLEEKALEAAIGAIAGDVPPEDGGIGVLRAENLAPLAPVHGTVAIDFDRLRDGAAAVVEAEIPRVSPEVGRRGARSIPASGSGSEEEGTGPLRETLDRDRTPSVTAPFSGPEFGVVVHKSLELLDARTRDARAATDAAFAAILGGAPSSARDWVKSREAGHRDAVVRFLERVVKDPSVAPIWSAPRFRREVPFVFPAGGDFLAGTIDVLIEGKGGSLSIADYKTDRSIPPNAAALPSRYRGQALLTALALQEITGRAPREFRFLFLAADPVVPVSLEIDDDFLAEARAHLQRRRSAVA